MFIVKKSVPGAVIKWPVTVNTPVDGGKTKRFEFTGHFLRLSADEKDALRAEIDAILESSDSDAEDYRAQFVSATMKVMTDWSGVVDQDEKDLAFGREALLAAVRGVGGGAVIAGINRAIIEVELGEKRKN